MTVFRIIAVIVIVSILPAALAAALLTRLSPLSSYKSGFYFYCLIFCVLIAGILMFSVLERRAPVFGRIFWKGTPGLRRVALTFDDGPNEPFTSQIIGILKEYHVPAAFFLVGGNCRRFPDSVRRLAEAGHELGNHTWTHDVLPLKLPSSIREEIRKTSAVIEECAGKKPIFFRAPHGWRNPWVDGIARECGCTPVAWTLGVWDTDRPGVEEIVRRTLKGVRDGSVLLLHDGRGIERDADSSQLLEALPAILEELTRRGYRFVTLAEMMERPAR